MVRLLSILVLILSLLLFPPATLALISNNAVPGDATYPIKRGLEDVIYAIVSLHPVTKAWFSAARSDRRFQELTVLLTQGKQAEQILKEMVEQTEIAASQITQVTDKNQKEKLIEQLSQSITKYDEKLQQVTHTQPLPTPTPTLKPVPTPAPTTEVTPIPMPIGKLRPTPTPEVILPPKPIPSVPSVISPTPQPQPLPPPEQPDNIEEARKRLEEIKKRLEEEKKKVQKLELEKDGIDRKYQKTGEDKNKKEREKKEENNDKKTNREDNDRNKKDD